VVFDDSVEFESRADRWGDRSDDRKHLGRGQRSQAGAVGDRAGGALAVHLRSCRVAEARKLFERLVGLSNDLGLLAEEYDVGRQRLGRQLPPKRSATSP
jgi:hypothetical protein